MEGVSQPNVDPGLGAPNPTGSKPPRYEQPEMVDLGEVRKLTRATHNGTNTDGGSDTYFCYKT